MLRQAFDGCKVSPELEQIINISKDELPYIHGRMICSEKMVTELTKSFADKNWILLVNSTSIKLYTSDNPIGKVESLENKYTNKIEDISYDGIIFSLYLQKLV